MFLKTLEIRQNAYKASMPDLVTTDCDSDYDYPDDDKDRPQGREGSSSETEGIVLKHPRNKAKRRQGIYAGRRKDRIPILFSPDCQRPYEEETFTAGLKASMPAKIFLFFQHMKSQNFCYLSSLCYLKRTGLIKS